MLRRHCRVTQNDFNGSSIRRFVYQDMFFPSGSIIYGKVTVGTHLDTINKIRRETPTHLENPELAVRLLQEM